MTDDLKNVLSEFRLQLVIHPVWHGLPYQFGTLGRQACDAASCQATDEESGWKFLLKKTPRHLGGSQTMVKRQGLDWWGLSPNGETGNTMNSSSSSQWWIITMRYFIIIFTIVISTSITPPCCLGSVNPFDNPKTINDTQWLNPRRSSLHLKASKFGDIWGYPRNLQFYCSCNGKKNIENHRTSTKWNHENFSKLWDFPTSNVPSFTKQ